MDGLCFELSPDGFGVSNHLLSIQLEPFQERFSDLIGPVTWGTYGDSLDRVLQPGLVCSKDLWLPTWIFGSPCGSSAPQSHRHTEVARVAGHTPHR